MKKIIYMLSVFLIFSLALFIFAADSNVIAQTGQEIGKEYEMSPLPSGNQIGNKNRVNTQNQGEDTDLQINTQEQENLGEGQEVGSQNRNQNAILHMSEVAKYVEQLLQIRTTGGIGDQVRLFAREQNQAQTQTQEQIDRLESRKGIARSLLGPDYNAIKSLNELFEQNRIRILRLEALQNQLSNQEDITAVQETIQALIQQNTALQEVINSEEQTRSLFGWLFKLFAR